MVMKKKEQGHTMLIVNPVSPFNILSVNASFYHANGGHFGEQLVLCSMEIVHQNGCCWHGKKIHGNVLL